MSHIELIELSRVGLCPTIVLIELSPIRLCPTFELIELSPFRLCPTLDIGRVVISQVVSLIKLIELSPVR